VNEREGGNWLGQSLLRPAYKNWLLKDRMLRPGADGRAQRPRRPGLHGRAKVPEGVVADERDKWQQVGEGGRPEARDRLPRRRGRRRVHPERRELELKGVTGKLPDTDKPIRYHDEQIARAVLAHFLNLGTETGSWALGSTFANFFTDSLNAVASAHRGCHPAARRRGPRRPQLGS
jgi:hypothetical protein